MSEHHPKRMTVGERFVAMLSRRGSGWIKSEQAAWIDREVRKAVREVWKAGHGAGLLSQVTYPEAEEVVVNKRNKIEARYGVKL